jgi:hypothetical protein
VAEYSDPDFPDDFGDRVCLADPRGSDAETKKRRIGSSFRERCHREHFWSSDRNGSYQSDGLPRVYLFRGNLIVDRAHRQAERRATRRLA